MTKKICLVDPGIHASVVEAFGSGLTELPERASALVTQDRDIDASMIAAGGAALEAIFILEPGSAAIASTRVPIHRVENLALTGVAEHAVLLMLALAKRLPWVLDKTRKREWSEGASEPELTTQKDYGYNWVGLKEFGVLADRTVGLVGLGYIGKATARILRGFSANVIYYKPTRLSDEEERELDVSWCTLSDLLEASDFVSLHHRFVEGSSGNDKEFGAELLRRMKPTAFLVNTARGRMVDEDALYDAIESGEIAGAALDVFRYEPLPDDHRFFRLPPEKIILTPHLAGVPMQDAAETAVRQIVDTLDQV